MSFEVPEDLSYLQSHEWVRAENGSATIGITDFAQDELGDVVFVELPEEGTTLDQEEQFGLIESIKAVSDLHSPVMGEVTEVNNRLESEPELVNNNPYGDAWILRIDFEGDLDEGPLLTADEYREQIE